MAEEAIRRMLDAIRDQTSSELTELLLLTSEAAWNEVEARTKTNDPGFVIRDPGFFEAASRCRTALNEAAMKSPSVDEADRIALAVLLQRLTLLAQLHNDIASYYQLKSGL